MKTRRNEIVKLLNENSSMSVSELAQCIGVSQVTIRSDLKVLQEEGVINRIHGGASALADESIASRLNFRRETKTLIAQKAAELVSNGETIMIESGSTNALLARCLGETKNNVTIITNSLFIARYVKDYKNLNVVLLGGDFQPESEVVVGPLTKNCLNEFFVEKAFIGSDGFSEETGFTCVNMLRAEVARAMAARSSCTIIVTDSDKFGKRGVASQLPASMVTTVISDEGIPEKCKASLAGLGIQVITVRNCD